MVPIISLDRNVNEDTEIDLKQVDPVQIVRHPRSRSVCYRAIKKNRNFAFKVLFQSDNHSSQF